MARRSWSVQDVMIGFFLSYGCGLSGCGMHDVQARCLASGSEPGCLAQDVGLLERRALAEQVEAGATVRRGTFPSVRELTTAIGVFIDAYNHRAQPFSWTKDADELLTKNETVEQLMSRGTSRFRFQRWWRSAFCVARWLSWSGSVVVGERGRQFAVRGGLFEQGLGFLLQDADRVGSGGPAQRRLVGADELDQGLRELGGGAALQGAHA